MHKSGTNLRLLHEVNPCNPFLLLSLLQPLSDLRYVHVTLQNVSGPPPTPYVERHALKAQIQRRSDNRRQSHSWYEVHLEHLQQFGLLDLPLQRRPIDCDLLVKHLFL
jgi:hypothetical protein